MKKFLNRLYYYNVAGFIVSFAVAILVYINYHEKTVGYAFIPLMIMLSGASVFFLIRFFLVFLNGRSRLDDYLEYSEYTEEELSDEYDRSIKHGPVRLGVVHIFYICNNYINVVPISDIIYLDISEKRTTGTHGDVHYNYYLEITHMGHVGSDKLRFSRNYDAVTVVNTLLIRNPNIKRTADMRSRSIL